MTLDKRLQTIAGNDQIPFQSQELFIDNFEKMHTQSGSYKHTSIQNNNVTVPHNNVSVYFSIKHI